MAQNSTEPHASPDAATGSRSTAAVGARLLLIAALLLIGSVAVRFVSFDEVASLANDSATYLVMARHFAALGHAGDVVDRAYHQETYPPFFPAVLAATGAAGDLVRAHRVVAVAFTLCCLLVYLLARERLPGRIVPIATACAFAALPGAWTNLLGILSENVYLLCSLGALLVDARSREMERGGTGAGIALGVAIALAVLTRSVGLAFVLALGLRALIVPAARGWRRTALPAAIAIGAFAAWSVAAPHVHASYLYQLLVRYRAVVHHQHLLGYVALDVVALASAWLDSLLLFWSRLGDPRFVLAVSLGCLALGGTIARARRGELDGLYVLCYLAVVVVWPYRSEMPRFVYPVLPLLVLHAVEAAASVQSWLAPRLSRNLAPLGTVAVFAVVSVPALAFVHGRATYAEHGRPYPYRHVAEFYRIPDLALARIFASHMALIMVDLRRVGHTTPAGATVLWVKPEFVALLAGRRGVTTPRGEDPAFLRRVRDAGAGYVLVSEATARGNEDGPKALRYFRPFSTVVWEGKAPQSVLLRIDRGRLDALIAGGGG